MMTKREFLALFEEILEAAPGTLTGTTLVVDGGYTAQ